MLIWRKKSINGSCFDQYSFPIAITIVIVFAAVKVIVTVIMVLVSLTNLADLRWLWSCWHLCPSCCPWGGTQVLALAQSLAEFTGGKHGGCRYIVRAVIFGLVILVPYLVICLCYIHIVCKLRNSRQDLAHCCAIFLCYLNGGNISTALFLLNTWYLSFSNNNAFSQTIA